MRRLSVNRIQPLHGKTPRGLASYEHAQTKCEQDTAIARRVVVVPTLYRSMCILYALSNRVIEYLRTCANGRNNSMREKTLSVLAIVRVYNRGPYGTARTDRERERE